MSNVVGKVANEVMAAIEPRAAKPQEVSADEETKKLEAPSYEPSEGARRTQKLIEAIEQRRQEKARLVSEKLRRNVEVERANREGAEILDGEINKLEAELQLRMDELKATYRDGVVQRGRELVVRQQQIDKLDVSLDQLRKQLDAELGKLDPERKVSA